MDRVFSAGGALDEISEEVLLCIKDDAADSYLSKALIVDGARLGSIAGVGFFVYEHSFIKVLSFSV